MGTSVRVIATVVIGGALSFILRLPLAKAQDTAPAPAGFSTYSASNSPRQFAISYVESKQKWKFGMFSESWDKVSGDVQGLLVQGLAAKGWTRVDSLPKGSCCKVVIEILAVSEDLGVAVGTGIDVAGTISIQDDSGRQVYLKAYRGESAHAALVLPGMWGHMISTAVKKMADAAAQDDDLTKALTGGGLDTNAAATPASAPGGSPAGPAANSRHEFAVSYVPSSRKWKIGPYKGQSYDKISMEIQDLLVRDLATKGWTRVDSPSGACCKAVIEIVEVSEHLAQYGKSGMDLVATISVLDSAGRQVYAKGYRGEPRSMVKSLKRMFSIAEQDMVTSVVSDENLITALDGQGNH